MSRKILVVGAGYGGMSCAAQLAKSGHDVTVVEKNPGPGGRCRQWDQEGFVFDMGPSWYMMPEVFDAWFKKMGRSREDYYEIERLTTRYRMYFSKDDYVDVSDDMEKMKMIFDGYEVGAGDKLDAFLKKAQVKYEVASADFMYKANQTIWDLFNISLLRHLPDLNVFGNYGKELRSYFQDPRILKIMEWVIMFVGCSPRNAPGVYSLMNWADWGTGVWYPTGGFYEVTKALAKVCEEEGVRFQFNEEVIDIVSENGRVKNVVTTKGENMADIVVVNGDYAWCEMELLAPEDRTFNESYWQSRVLSPSVLCWYIGIKGSLKSLLHHTYFAGTNVDEHFEEIYEKKCLPKKPLFYVCNASKSDTGCAPKSHENLFVLIPMPANVEDTEEIRERYWNYVMDTMEAYEGKTIRDRVVVKRSYGLRDLKDDYHALGGHGFGLANTLWQTAIWRPGIKSKKVEGLWYTGCMTVPGVGLPTSLISGEVVAREILR